MEEPPPPKRVGLTEWDSLEKAEAFFKSKAFTDLPDREKAIKTIRPICGRSSELGDLRRHRSRSAHCVICARDKIEVPRATLWDLRYSKPRRAPGGAFLSRLRLGK
jgi:hypothetical protein